MDILFIYPPISVSERYARNVGTTTGGNLPPLGITQLSSYLREKGFKVGLIDGVIEDLSIDQMVEKVLELNPKIIGLSALTPNFHRAIAFATLIKKRNPEILIILGGHHATILPREILEQNDCFDLIVHGEGELTAEEIVNKYKNSGWRKNDFTNNTDMLSKIKGIAFKHGKEIIITPKRELIQNLDELPFPAWDLLSMDKYIPLANQYKRTPVINMVVIRGCPFNCSFCSGNSVFGRKIRAMSPQRVVEQISYVMENYGIREISFWDDMMTANKKWLYEFCDLLIKNKIDITWTCYSRVDCIDEEILRRMKKAGCWNIFFGYESGCQELLNNINKGTTLKQIENANMLCKKVGIEIRASFMIALPGETPEMARKTIDFAKKLNPDYAQFCITTPYPGTKLFEDATKYGVLDGNFSEYNIWNAVFVPYGYKNREEIEAMEKRAMREFYLRPKYIWGRLKKINSWEDIKRYLKGFRFFMGFLGKKTDKKKS
ncbi:MAG: radical SAM protein [Patescibacteria group bacterium]